MRAFLAGKVGNTILGVVLAAAVFIAMNAVFGLGGAVGGAVAGAAGFGAAAGVKRALSPPAKPDAGPGGESAD